MGGQETMQQGKGLPGAGEQAASDPPAPAAEDFGDERVGDVGMAFVWLIALGIAAFSALVGFGLLMFGLQAPDHGLPSSLVWRRTGSMLGGELVAFTFAVRHLARRECWRGLGYALLMLPAAFLLLMIFDH